MNIQRSEENGITILTLEGRLDSAHTAAYDHAFAEAFSAGARKFVIDCASLVYISSAGLRCILKSLKQIGSGGKLAIASPAPMVLEIFEISGFKSLLTIRPDRSAALSAIS